MKANNQTWCFVNEDADGNKIDISIYGASETAPHRRLNLSFMPCDPVVSDDPDLQCRINENTP
jgi:hypothetical protein